VVLYVWAEAGERRAAERNAAAGNRIQGRLIAVFTPGA
jgi:hypothetical protein